MGIWEARLLFLMIKDGKMWRVLTKYYNIININIKIKVIFVLKKKNTWRIVSVLA